MITTFFHLLFFQYNFTLLQTQCNGLYSHVRYNQRRKFQFCPRLVIINWVQIQFYSFIIYDLTVAFSIFFCYSLTLCFLSRRVTQIKTYSWDNAQVILVGNKCDMEDERVISFERGKQLADQLGVEFFETSAKENVNVKVS